MENWTNAKLCDVANLILGAILFFSPWMFGFDAGRSSENAHIAGVVIAVLAIAGAASVFLMASRFLSVSPLLYTLRNGHRVSLLTAINLSQMSEFSLVLIQVGVADGQTSTQAASGASLALQSRSSCGPS